MLAAAVPETAVPVALVPFPEAAAVEDVAVALEEEVEVGGSSSSEAESPSMLTSTQL